ncbi:MAG: metal-sensitive transcriptional regulator [Armatimonadota bacterium]|nr:metal-sensitive transcriptional regulator [Armatimonadota bacterium]MDR7443961.1 metal-sensitive transcriptional regulator [Armatimonadota bacterium]MDR7570059.1 metal-sensitive transcriptional regulator [Armatimonadota bacterium]MDR7615436.1 metal-sensitive transcriptional regulator [Armatimonadota bacterium]
MATRAQPRRIFQGTDPRAKQEILARLRSIEGHVRGVLRMVEEDAYCIDVLKQTKAIQAALDRVNALLLERHLNHCVTTAIRSQDPKERERVITELLEVFEAGGERR